MVVFRTATDSRRHIHATCHINIMMMNHLVTTSNYKLRLVMKMNRRSKIEDEDEDEDAKTCLSCAGQLRRVEESCFLI